MNSIPAIDVSQEQWDIVRGILKRHLPGTEVWAFGSRAKWTAKAYSDLDLAAITDRPLPLAVSAAIADEFSNSNLPWKVDLVDWAAISDGFRAIVARDKVVIQSKTGTPDAANWPLVPISSVATVFDGPHATPEKAASGPVFLGITCLDEGRLDLSRAEHLSERDFVTWTRRVTPTGGDVVFSYETRIGAAAVIPDGLRCCLGRRMGLVRPDPARLDARFFLYQYLSPEFQSLLRSRTIHGSTVDRISIKEFPDFEIRLPPLTTQREIARILGSLDDKIELNHRMMDTLEAMTRAIFQSWFVDFDPVRAKASGEDHESICRRLGLTPELLALFPESFVNSKIEEIPEGWTVVPLAALSEKISKGTTPSKADIASSKSLATVPFIKVKDISEQGDVIRDGLELIPKSVHEGVLRRSILEVGDILFSIAGTIGRVAVVDPDLANSNANQAVSFIRLADKATHLGLCLQHLKSERLKEVAKASVVQAVQANISLASLGAFQILVPSAEVLAAWNKRFIDLFARRRGCLAEARVLECLRDALLPKLLSGEQSPGEVRA